MPSFGAVARLGTELAGTYQLRSVLGQGGMGVVYEAEHSWTGRRVAVKVIARDGVEPRANQRALNEARLATQLHHPNVVDVLDMGEDEPGVVYLAMEYLEGRPLSALLQERERLEPAAALELLLPIVGAVATAHDAGILHRDLKPSNLFVSERRGRAAVPKLLDFGIAKVTDQDTLTKTGAVVGTPHYMAPEQAADGVTSPATDTWAIGVVLHECLRGQRPYDAGSATAILLKIVNAPAPRLNEVAPWVPKALAAVVDRALEREPKQRFASARDLARALLAAAVQDRIAVPVDPDPIGLPEWKRWRAELENATLSSELAAVGPRAEARPDRAPRRRLVVALGVAVSVGVAAGVWMLSAREHGAAVPTPSAAAAPSPAAFAASSAAPQAPIEAIQPRLPAPRPLTELVPSARGTRSTRPVRVKPQPSSEPVPAASVAPSSPRQTASASGIPDLVHEW